MRFPKERIRFSKSEDGQATEAGYLVLDLKGLDIEGAAKFVIDMDLIEKARMAGDKQADAVQKARSLLGG
jgi:hypothetical protein